MPEDVTSAINGWTPPVFREDYGLGTRIATQADVDRLQRQVDVLGTFYAQVSRMAEDVKSRLRSLDDAG